MAEEEAPFLPGAEDSDEGIEISFRPRRQFAVIEQVILSTDALP